MTAPVRTSGYFRQEVKITGLDTMQRQLARLSSTEIPKALFPALNKVGAKAQTEVDRAIRERFAIKSDQVRKSFVFIRSKQQGQDVVAVLQIFGSPTRRGRSMNLIRFVEKKVTLAEGRRRTKSGTLSHLRFKILRGSGLKEIAGTFIGNQGRTVFRRTGKERLPIEPVQVIGVSQMFNTRTVRKRVEARIERELVVEVRRAVELVIRRRT